MRRLVFRAVRLTRKVKRDPIKPIRKIANDVAVASALEVLVHHKAPQITLVIDVTAAYGISTCIKLFVP